MADGGILEALAAMSAWEATAPAAVYGGLAAEGGAGAAAGLGAGAAATGAGASAASSGLLSPGAADFFGVGASGAAKASPEAIAAIEAAGPGGGAEGLNAGAHQFVTDYDKYKFAAQNGFRALGKGFNKLPGPVQGAVTQPVMQGLFGGAPQQPRENVMRPMGGGGGGPQAPLSYPQQPMPKATPYAMTAGGPDDEEMRRRLMMLYGRAN